jgi:uncharacterized protein
LSLRDTINWRDWSRHALAEAVAEDKPILLSLVTAWSDECAAMDEATYRDPEVVAAAQGRCVAIRVDADRRPDLNERYNLGGWPTTALLTPDGHVLSGATYLGPDAIIALIHQAADAWRDRAEEIRARIADAERIQAGADGTERRVGEDGEEKVRLKPDTTTTGTTEETTSGAGRLGPDTTAGAWYRALLIEEFDPVHGGFGGGPKAPHPAAVQFAIALIAEDADESLMPVVDLTLDGIDRLWDSGSGGFYRYADAPDWSAPATEKTLEDNAAVLNLLLDAAVRLNSEACRERAADLVRWVKHALADAASGGGFFNSRAAVSGVVDRSLYIDRNAEMIGAFIRAAAIFEDPWLRDFALHSLEAVVVPGYVPGGGIAHEHVASRPPDRRDDEPVRGLLADQIRVTSALMWAHQVTGQLPYSMLAAELMTFAIRSMWDEHASCFRDRLEASAPFWPFALNCEAACILDRLSTMTGDPSYRDRGIAILAAFSRSYRRHGMFAAPYALAIREVMGRHAPPDLNLSRVEWHLDKD